MQVLAVYVPNDSDNSLREKGGRTGFFKIPCSNEEVGWLNRNAGSRLFGAGATAMNVLLQ
jgi:hypothetical protein